MVVLWLKKFRSQFRLVSKLFLSPNSFSRLLLIRTFSKNFSGPNLVQKLIFGSKLDYDSYNSSDVSHSDFIQCFLMFETDRKIRVFRCLEVFPKLGFQLILSRTLSVWIHVAISLNDIMMILLFSIFLIVQNQWLQIQYRWLQLKLHLSTNQFNLTSLQRDSG